MTSDVGTPGDAHPAAVSATATHPAFLQPGRYRHYKGRDYIVIDVARHSETDEWLVVYRKDYGDRSLWVRPLAMFTESVVVDDESWPRFAFIESASSAHA